MHEILHLQLTEFPNHFPHPQKMALHYRFEACNFIKNKNVQNLQLYQKRDSGTGVFL